MIAKHSLIFRSHHFNPNASHKRDGVGSEGRKGTHVSLAGDRTSFRKRSSSCWGVTMRTVVAVCAAAAALSAQLCNAFYLPGVAPRAYVKVRPPPSPSLHPLRLAVCSSQSLHCGSTSWLHQALASPARAIAPRFVFTRVSLSVCFVGKDSR